MGNRCYICKREEESVDHILLHLSSKYAVVVGLFHVWDSSSGPLFNKTHTA